VAGRRPSGRWRLRRREDTFRGQGGERRGVVQRVVAVGFAMATLVAAAAATEPAPAAGATLYGAACAACHGADLAGGAVPAGFAGFAALRAPALAGPCALRTFATAAELLAYVRYDMPLQAPGSLSNDDARAVVAFLLERNGVRGAGPLTLSRASAIAVADRQGRGAACPGAER
jgi:cytochrome c